MSLLWRFIGSMVLVAATLNAQAAAPSCTLTPSPAVIPASSNSLVTHTATCTGAVASVLFRDHLGDILTVTTPPFQVVMGYGPTTSTQNLTFVLEAYACSPAPVACSSSFDTVIQVGVGQPPPAPSCTAYADPGNLPAAGGSVLLQAACAGLVGTVTWRESGSVLGQATAPPYDVTTSVPANSAPSVRTWTYELTACTVNSSSCSTSSVSVTQAAAAAPPPPVAPVCTTSATPANLPAAGGNVTLTANCTGSVGSTRWTDASGIVLGQPATAPYGVTANIAANVGAARNVNFRFTACATSAGTICVSQTVTVTQSAAAAPPPPAVPPPVCAAQAVPAQLPASGGLVTLTAACSGTAVAMGIWRDSQGAVIGQMSTPPYEVVTTVVANGSTTPTTSSFTFVACATGGNPCSTSTASVTQDAAAAAGSAPECTTSATPAQVTAQGGLVTLWAACIGTPVGSFSWQNGNGQVLQQGSGTPGAVNVTLPTNSLTTSRTWSYQLQVCAGQPAACSSSTVFVQQAAALPPPSGCMNAMPVVTRSRACAVGFTGSLVEQQVFACVAGQWQSTPSWYRVQGSCQLSSSASAVVAVEYYQAGFDHYFLTAEPAETVALDSGKFVGWERTAQHLGVTPAAASVPSEVAMPVCRFYGNPAYGLDSHFYTASATECQVVQWKWPEQWHLESTNVFQVVIASGGTCPPGTTPVVRFYNNRPDVNHRYVVDPVLQEEMRLRGWVEEGVVFCAQ